MPKITPTAFSARWNNDDSVLHESKSRRTEQGDLPSSPPLPPVGDGTRDSAEESQRLAEPRTPDHISSSVICDLERDVAEDEMMQGNKLRPRALTSSVVKGEAANSLLELVRGAQSQSGSFGMRD
jgi:hypothetical protein